MEFCTLFAVCFLLIIVAYFIYDGNWYNKKTKIIDERYDYFSLSNKFNLKLENLFYKNCYKNYFFDFIKVGNGEK